ncbi:MAG: hypothetical protein HYZ72_20570 [Deltaproteobacteria bacterium]|nr:hypothetical protein [Deltaproteobacteria bacterium]
MQQTASTALFQHLASLTASFSQLGARLTQAARELQDPGLPPRESLAGELAASRRDFTALCARGLTLAESLAVSPLPTPAALASLSDLKALLQAVAHTEEKQAAVEDLRQRALMVLDRVLTMRHRDGIAFPPLLECQAKASDLRRAVAEARWPEPHPATEALAEGTDPFSDLLTLVERQEELDDDHWGILQDTVEHSFGKPLAVAASRGKFAVPAEPSLGTSVSVAVTGDEAAALPDPSQTATAPSAGAPEVALDSSPVPDEALTHEDAAPPTSAPEDTHTPSEMAAQDVATLLFPLEPEERQEEEKAQPQPLYRFGLEDTAQKIAAPLLQGTIEERPAALRDLIWRLLFEDKVSLAFHLARCLETQYPDLQPRLPSWLLRAVVLGRHVRHANGETARLLTEDFAKFDAEPCTGGHGEWNQAVEFLAATAALQPALLAPHTKASAVLHALQWDGGLPHFSAYCRRIADYGDTLEPLDPNALKKGKEQAAWQAEVDALKQAVESWWYRAPRLALTYTPATRVWGKWLEPRGLIATLLLPVKHNDLSKLPTVKRAVEQVADDAQIRREIEHTDRDVLGRRLGDDITGRALDQLRTHTREAVGFARRWIELHDSRSGQRKDSAQEQAEHLRQEVWSRHEAVLEELSAFKRRHPSPLLMSGVACCRRVLENIQILFDPEASFPTEEPLPRPLLYADLLRIPSLVLNDQWEVEDSDQVSLVDGILDLVAHGVLKKAVA